MDIERMRLEAEKFAQFRLEKIEQGLAVMAAREIAEEGLRNRRAAELHTQFEAERLKEEELRPQLEEQARKEHQERFNPLQELLEPFKVPVMEIRDAYFPDSKIAVADHYDRGDRGQHVYYRGLIVTDNGGFTNHGRRLFGVYAVAVDNRDRQEMIYGIDISLTYQEKLPPVATQDFQCVTSDSDLFRIYGGQYSFNTSDSTPDYFGIRGTERIEYERGAEGLFKPKSYFLDTPIEDRIERRFMGVVRRIEVDNLLVKNGHGFHSQFASLEGSSFD